MSTDLLKVSRKPIKNAQKQHCQKLNSLTFLSKGLYSSELLNNQTKNSYLCGRKLAPSSASSGSSKGEIKPKNEFNI